MRRRYSCRLLAAEISSTRRAPRADWTRATRPTASLRARGLWRPSGPLTHRRHHRARPIRRPGTPEPRHRHRRDLLSCSTRPTSTRTFALVAERKRLEPSGRLAAANRLQDSTVWAQYRAHSRSHARASTSTVPPLTLASDTSRKPRPTESIICNPTRTTGHLCRRRPPTLLQLMPSLLGRTPPSSRSS